MVDNPNKGGNSAGEGAPKSEWDDISDLINFGPSNKTTQPNKVTITPSSNENTGDLDGGSGKTNPNHDTSDSKEVLIINQLFTLIQMKLFLTQIRMTPSMLLAGIY